MAIEAPVIEVRHLRKSYGPTLAVADVSLTVNRGEIFGILGPNGAGKTTTVEAMVGLNSIDAGYVRVLGVDPHRESARVREWVGIQLQHARLPARLRVGEALNLYASFYQDPADPAQLLDRLGLTTQRRTAFANLSGGQQQRLSIALALVGNPRIAVLDELTTGLDPQARRATWGLIEDVRAGGVTVVLVTHSMDEAERLCDRLVIIADGSVAASGRPHELGQGTQSPKYVLTLPAHVDRFRLHALTSTLPRTLHLTDRQVEVSGGPDALTAVLTTLARDGITPTDITTVRRGLEDIYLDLAGS